MTDSSTTSLEQRLRRWHELLTGEYRAEDTQVFLEAADRIKELEALLHDPRSPVTAHSRAVARAEAEVVRLRGLCQELINDPGAATIDHPYWQGRLESDE